MQSRFFRQTAFFLSVVMLVGLCFIDAGAQSRRRRRARRHTKKVVRPVITNIVVFDLPARSWPTAVSAAMKERGVLINAVNDQFMRAVTHHDVSAAQCAEAMDALEEVLRVL